MKETLDDNLQANRYCEIAIAKWCESDRNERVLSLAMLRAGAALLIDQVGEDRASEWFRRVADAIEAGVDL